MFYKVKPVYNDHPTGQGELKTPGGVCLQRSCTPDGTTYRCFYVVDNIYQRVRGNSTQLQRMLN